MTAAQIVQGDNKTIKFAISRVRGGKYTKNHTSLQKEIWHCCGFCGEEQSGQIGANRSDTRRMAN